MTRIIALLFTIVLTACQPNQTTETPEPKQKIDEFFTTSLSKPVGWKLKETMGFECRMFQYSGTGDYAEKFVGTLNGIVEEGKKKNANAFVNMQVSSASYEVQGSKWHSSIIHICGDYVVIE